MAAVAGVARRGRRALVERSRPAAAHRTGPARAARRAVGATAPTPPPGLAIAKRGEVVPALQLPDWTATPSNCLPHFAGRPVLINLWASWCGPCIQEMPELDRFAAAQGANGTQVVGIALDDAPAVRAFLQRIPVRYPILLDQPGPRDAGVPLGNPKGVLPYTVLVSARRPRCSSRRSGRSQTGEIEAWAQ